MILLLDSFNVSEEYLSPAHWHSREMRFWGSAVLASDSYQVVSSMTYVICKCHASFILEISKEYVEDGSHVDSKFSIVGKSIQLGAGNRR